ncbi:MAG TPA: PAS domain-containing protein [Terriglobia bacterium]|nr:PAS domain-containing protein [Terriglobia bacterium]
MSSVQLFAQRAFSKSSPPTGRNRVCRTLDGVAHLALICGEGGKVEVVNRPWRDFTGLATRQSLGDGWRTAVHLKDLPRFENRWTASITEGQPTEIDVCLRRHDGGLAAASFHLMPFYDPLGRANRWYVSTTFGKRVSSSEESAPEARTELSPGQLRTIIDAIPILAWSTAKDGPGEFLNKRWLDYTGLSLEEAIGYGWRTIIHPDDLGPLFEYWLWMMRTGSSGEFEARMRRHDGQYRWFLFRGAPFLDSVGSVLKWFGVNIDINDRKEAEAALRQTQATLSRANQLATVGELTASIAHEINQPLAAVVANAEAGLQWLGKETPNLGRVRKALERIARDAADAGEIITRLRALFRRTSPVTAEHRLEELVAEVLKLVEHETVRRGVSIDVVLKEGLPTVICDRLQIQQVLLNLILNAMDALDASPHEKSIRVFSRSDGAESVVLGVRDYGVGVQDPSRLFETFFTTKEKGLGMGLAISRSIVEAHGGRLWLESTHGPGSTFCFRLPAKFPGRDPTKRI